MEEGLDGLAATAITESRRKTGKSAVASVARAEPWGQVLRSRRGHTLTRIGWSAAFGSSEQQMRAVLLSVHAREGKTPTSIGGARGASPQAPWLTGLWIGRMVGAG
jgi:hypothetical protein